MTLFYFDASGAGVGMRCTPFFDANEKLPSSFVTSITVDEATNAVLVDDFAEVFAQYTYVAGKFKKNGATVEIVADGAAKAALDNLLSQADTAINTNDIFLGLNNPTNAQVLAQVRALTRQSTTVIKRFKLLGRMVAGANNG